MVRTQNLEELAGEEGKNLSTDHSMNWVGCIYASIPDYKQGWPNAWTKPHTETIQREESNIQKGTWLT